MDLLSTTKAYHKRSRRGKVLKITSDHYIRTDITLGYLHKKPLLHSDLASLLSNSASKNNIVIVLDTNILMHGIDIFDDDSKQLPLQVVIVLQTVLEEIKQLNMSIYKRIMNLLNDENQYYIFLPNELVNFTCLNRDEGEIMNDYNDRLIRKATLYLTNNISNSKVILLTNDHGNYNKSLLLGLNCCTLVEYIQQYLSNYPSLVDMLSVVNRSLLPSNKKDEYKHKQLTYDKYSKHIAVDEISLGLRSKKYYKGIVRISNRTSWCKDAYVVVTLSGDVRKSILLKGKNCINRAVDGDLVAVEIIDEKDEIMNTNDLLVDSLASNTGSINVMEETAEPSIATIEGLQLDTGNKEEDATTVDASSVAASDATLYGKVIGIIKRNWRQYAGSIDMEGKFDYAVVRDNIASNDSISCLFHPIDKRIPPIRIVTCQRSVLLNQRLLVAIDDWPEDSLLPHGHYVTILGDIGEKNIETTILLHEFNVTTTEFSKDVMACLPASDWCISPDIIAKRSDLRHLPIVSIDPPGCKDIDDALHCIELENGNLEIGVHIADVTYFVHPDTPLDKEAAHRSTSTYLVERRLDMLPSLLTTELCSLRSSEDHLAFSVIWEMKHDGTIVDVKFCKSVIHSKASLTYDEAQTMLDTYNGHVGKASRDVSIPKSVNLLNKIARILRQKRIDAGALTLASPEVRFKLDSETSNPTDVNAYVLKEANALVEEFMLLANITVSKKVLKHFPTLAVLRRHAPPSREQFQPLLDSANAVNVTININTSKTLADTLELAVRPNDPYFNKLLRILSTRCMMPAQYFCSGEVPKDQWHHYGLAAPVYTHFTSPIRRYADIIVHRLLAASIGVIALPAGNADRSKQQELCSHMNRRHKAAQYAQRASVNLYTLLYFKASPLVEAAYILSLNQDGITALVPKFGIEGNIKMDSILKSVGVRLQEVEVKYDHVAQKVHIEKNKQNVLTLQVFQQVAVYIHVEESNTGDRTLVMELDSKADKRKGGGESSADAKRSKK